MKGDLRRRLSESVEAAAALAGGVVEVDVLAQGAPARPRTRPSENVGGVKGAKGAGQLPRASPTGSPSASASPASTAAPRSPSSSRGSSPSTRRTAPASAATGSASSGSIDPELVVPDPTLSLSEGALQPWRTGHSPLLEAPDRGGRRGLRDRPRHALAGALRRGPRDLPLRHRRRAPQGHLHEPLRPPALLQRPLRGHRQQPRAPLRGDRLRGSRASGSRATWPSSPARTARARGCGRRASRSRSAGSRIHEYTRAVGAGGAELDRGARADRDRAGDRAAARPRDHRAARLPRQRRGRLPRRWRARRARSPAARRSGSGSRPRSARAWSACSTSSTSPRSACTSATTRS